MTIHITTMAWLGRAVCARHGHAYAHTKLNVIMHTLAPARRVAGPRSAHHVAPSGMPFAGWSRTVSWVIASGRAMPVCGGVATSHAHLAMREHGGACVAAGVPWLGLPGCREALARVAGTPRHRHSVVPRADWVEMEFGQARC